MRFKCHREGNHLFNMRTTLDLAALTFFCLVMPSLFQKMTGLQKMKISQIKGFIFLIGCVRVMKVTHRFTTFIPEALEYTQLEDYYTS